MRRRRNDFWFLAALIAAAFLLGRFQAGARAQGSTDLPSLAARKLVFPGSESFRLASDYISDTGAAILGGQKLVRQNAYMKARLGALATYANDIAGLRQEIEDLRRLSGWMQSPGRAKIPADVIGFFPHEDRITLNVGLSQGVAKGMAVASIDGFVGRVQTVEQGACQVLLITARAPENRIGALVQRGPGIPPPAGLVSGAGPGSLTLDLADSPENVSIGDTVVTGGFSEQIPRGLRIGKITRLEDDPAFGRRTATVMPSASIGTLREVVVIK